MSREPSFDELVGAEPMGSERERLRMAHELLLQAGPPPELPPELEAGPQLGRVSAARRRQMKRRGMLLLAATLAVVAVFFAGYGVAQRGGGTNAVAQLALKGTPAAPGARATLALLPKRAGNWPMRLSVKGLPKLPAEQYYTVFLVRKGAGRLPCGTFVTAGGAGTLTVSLNAPYRLRQGDTWIVAREAPRDSGTGPTVLRPA
jgi:hypothetical protein